MKILTSLLTFFCFFTANAQNEKAWNYIPQEIKNYSDSIIISEIGKTAFLKHIKFNSANSFKKAMNSSKKIDHYEMRYDFIFEEAKEKPYRFQLDCFVEESKLSCRKEIVYGRYTTLPLTLQKKPLKIITQSDAMKIAIKADTTLKKNPELISIIYPQQVRYFKKSEKNSQETFFIWDLYWTKEVGEEARWTVSHHIIIDAVNGDVVRIYDGR